MGGRSPRSCQPNQLGQHRALRGVQAPTRAGLAGKRLNSTVYGYTFLLATLVGEICRAHARRRPGRRNPIACGGPAAGRSRVGRLRENGHRESDGGERRRGRRPAGFCQKQTLVMTEQFSSMECDAFHVAYLSDTILEAVFHGQAVKNVAYLRVSTTSPRGGSIATPTSPASPAANDSSQFAISDSPSPPCSNSCSPSTFPASSSTHAWCFRNPLSTSANHDRRAASCRLR